MEMFDLPKEMSAIIKVIGVGGGGSNAVNYMYNQGIKGVDFIVCNTDCQALDTSPVPYKIQLGKTLTEGRGAGMIPEIGMNAALENIEEIREILSKNTKMVFITAGMGGGTGTGAAPVIAQVARELGILTVGIVTTPFAREGHRRILQAAEGLDRMRQYVDTLLVINNEKLRFTGKNLGISKAFHQADDISAIAARGIAEVISFTGYINVDFNDVNTVLRNSGQALMGSASAEGDDRALKAVKAAMNSPLLSEDDIHGAKFVLLNITYGEKEALMDEVMEITDFIQDAAGECAEVIWGHGLDTTLGEKLSITVIATGFSSNEGSQYVAPERKVMDLDEDMKKEIVSPLNSPLQSAQASQSETPHEPYLVQEVNNTTNASEVSDAPVAVTNQPIQVQPNVEATPLNTVKFDLFANQEEQDANTTIEWNVANENPTIFDLSEVSPVNTVSPSEAPSDAQPDVIRHILEDDVADKVKNYRIQSTVLPEEAQRRNEERVAKLQEITSKIQNAENIMEFENEPAYMRRNFNVNDETPSRENNVSRFGLSNDSNGDSGLRNNSYLHDNVD
jgi:cell division protein FtsZ